MWPRLCRTPFPAALVCGPVREEVVLKGRGHVTTRPSWWGRYVIYHEVVATSQNFMRQVCAVEADWHALPPPPPTPPPPTVSLVWFCSGNAETARSTPGSQNKGSPSCGPRPRWTGHTAGSAEGGGEEAFGGTFAVYVWSGVCVGGHYI